MDVLGNDGFRCWSERVSLHLAASASRDGVTCALIKVKNRNLFPSRSCYVVPKVRNGQLAWFGRTSSTHQQGSLTQVPSWYFGSLGTKCYSNPTPVKGRTLLVNSALKVLEREGIDEGIVCRCGIWFRAKLGGMNVYQYKAGEPVRVDPSSWVNRGLVESSVYRVREGDVLLGDEDLDCTGQHGYKTRVVIWELTGNRTLLSVMSFQVILAQFHQNRWKCTGKSSHFLAMPFPPVQLLNLAP